jgi:HEAT repeat protein/energy-coupling factor transporter ATP-binding protein EcfA2
LAQVSRWVLYFALVASAASAAERSGGSDKLIQFIDARYPPSTREWAILRLPEQRPPDLNRLVPLLTNTLADDPIPKVRLAAAYVLGVFGSAVQKVKPRTETNLPIRTESNIVALLAHKDAQLRRTAAEALGKIGFHGRPTILGLSVALYDPDEQVQIATAQALVSIGPNAAGAIGDLVNVLQNEKNSAALRHKACDALASMAADAAPAVPFLIKAFAAPDQEVHEGAAWALGNIGRDAAQAVGTLQRQLGIDTDVRSVRALVWALGRLGIAARPAIPALTKMLENEDPQTRETAGDTLQQIATSLLIAKQIDAIDELRAVADKLDSSGRPKMRDRAIPIKIDIGYLVRERQYADFQEFLRHRLAFLVAIIILLSLSWYLVRRFKPRVPDWLLNRAEALDRHTQTTTNAGVARQLSRLPAEILLRLAYRKSVLNTWISKHADAAIRRLSSNVVFVPLPVILNDKQVDELSADDLALAFADKTTTILITGESGSGKSTLAREIAKWCLEERPSKRPSRDRLFPVTPDTSRPISLRAERAEWMQSIAKGLAEIVQPPPPPVLIKVLIAKRRLLLIIDNLDEVTPGPLHLTDTPGRVLLTFDRKQRSSITSRWIINTCRIPPNLLERVLRALLMKPAESLISPAELSHAKERLSSMFRDGQTPFALAKIYAQELAAWQELGRRGKLPENVPDLVVIYLNQLGRSATGALDGRTFQRMLKRIAWKSIRRTFSPAPIARSALQTTLNSSVLLRAQQTDYFQHLSKTGVLRRWGSASIVVAPDIFAEYLAGLYILECRNRPAMWDALLARLKQPSTATESDGFVNALWDCCRINGPALGVPLEVIESLVETLHLTDSHEIREYRSNLQARVRMLALFDRAGGPFQTQGMEGFIHVRQASKTSGDLPMKFQRKDGSLGICLLDVEGHGDEAATEAEKIKDALINAQPAWGHGHPEEELKQADQIVRANGLKSVTMSFTVVDGERGSIIHANAGMPIPYLFRSGQAAPKEVLAAGLWVGQGYSKAFHNVAEETFEVGDTLVLYSDGFRETLDSTMKIFGRDGIVSAVIRSLRRPPEEIVATVCEAAAEYAGKETPRDDQTIVVVRRTPIPQKMSG